MSWPRPAISVTCGRRGGRTGRTETAAGASSTDGDRGWDFVHGFTSSRATLEANAKPLMGAIDRNGMIWVSWPKKASKVPTDMTEDVIRQVVLPIGLVDIKVAAVSDVWSGLKLMIRKELR